MSSSPHIPLYCATMALAWCASPLVAQQPAPALPAPIPGPPSVQQYESAVSLKASQILQPALLTGPLYRVREDVVTDWGMNTYAVDSYLYGTFLAHGNSQLLERIAELNALKRLDELMQTGKYRDAVEEAADEEEDAAEDVVPPSTDSIREVHSTGIGKFFQRLGDNIRTDRNEEKRKDLQRFQRKSSAGVAEAKRNLCRNLGVNPYTTNVALQGRLDGMSRALGIGGFTMVPGAASSDLSPAALLNRTRITPQLSALIYEKDANALREANQLALQQSGLKPADASAFLTNPIFSPWQQTQFVLAMQSLSTVLGMDAFVRDATTSTTEEQDGIFYTETANLMAQLKAAQWPISRIELHNNAPYCVLKDGSVLLALHWDYAQWSTTAEKCATWLQSLKVNGNKPPAITIAISGVATPRCRQEMEKRGLRLQDRQDRGPLN